MVKQSFLQDLASIKWSDLASLKTKDGFDCGLLETYKHHAVPCVAHFILVPLAIAIILLTFLLIFLAMNSVVLGFTLFVGTALAFLYLEMFVHYIPALIIFGLPLIVAYFLVRLLLTG